ncbi:MAG: ABC transporter substrate-binding protein [Thioalkalivibrio sp.]|nr:ABC transporter substrate-binding protein [Thioalkalivibrio sp.]
MTGLLIWGLVALVGVIALAVAWQFVDPAPPTQVRLATGAPGGAYEQVGSRYRSWFAEKGMGLEPVVTAGSMENWGLLLADEVDAALVQGGTAPPEAGLQLEAVVSIAFEPLFLFYRRDRIGAENSDGAADRLEALAGMRIAIGAEGSGTRSLVKTLLAEIGLDVRLAIQDIRAAWFEADRAAAQVQARRDTVALQEELLRVAEIRFRVGAATGLEVAQAQRDLLESQLSLRAVIIRFRQASTDLLLQSGTLLLHRGIETPGQEPVPF